MKEYIEREAVKAVFDGIYDCADMVFEPNDHCCSADDCGRCKWAQTKNAIKKMVMKIPAADVVEVVRCKDCKHKPTKLEKHVDGFDLEFPDDVCPCQCDDDPYYSWYPSDDWFCPRGERKGGNE